MPCMKTKWPKKKERERDKGPASALFCSDKVNRQFKPF